MILQGPLFQWATFRKRFEIQAGKTVQFFCYVHGKRESNETVIRLSSSGSLPQEEQVDHTKYYLFRRFARS